MLPLTFHIFIYFVSFSYLCLSLSALLQVRRCHRGQIVHIAMDIVLLLFIDIFFTRVNC